MDKTLPVVLLMIAPLALTGCIGADDTTPVDQPVETETENTEPELPLIGSQALPGFEVQFEDCFEAAGVSVYNSEEGAEGPTPNFTRADISEDVGNPAIGSYGIPIVSDHTTGIWHVAATCSSAAWDGGEQTDASFGWVGVRVEPPSWDDSGIERQYFIPDISFGTHDVVEDLREEGRVHATRMLSGGASWVGPDAFRMVLNDEVHGVFDAYGTVDQDRTIKEMSFDTVRFWLLVPADGTLQDEMDHDHEDGGLSTQQDAEEEGPHYRPVSIDMHTSSGDYRIGTTPAYLSHTRTNHHGPAGGAAGNVVGVTLEDFDRTFTLGPTPDVLVEETWLH